MELLSKRNHQETILRFTSCIVLANDFSGLVLASRSRLLGIVVFAGSLLFWRCFEQGTQYLLPDSGPGYMLV